jgi:hypothetical protein
MWFQTNTCHISFIYIKILGISKLTGKPCRGFRECLKKWNHKSNLFFSNFLKKLKYKSNLTFFQNLREIYLGQVAILNESYWMNQMILLEFRSRFSDVLHVTGNNRWIKIEILKKVDNFWYFSIIFWECMKNIELQILFDFFQNLLLEVHKGHFGNG